MIICCIFLQEMRLSVQMAGYSKKIVFPIAKPFGNLRFILSRKSSSLVEILLLAYVGAGGINKQVEVL